MATKIEQEALATINVIRRTRHRQPLTEIPQGHRKMFRSCPVAKALDAQIGYAWIVWADDDSLPTPKQILDFISAFDAGKLPQYEITDGNRN